jgi:DNA repair protein RadC
MHQVVSVVRWTDFTPGLTSSEIVAIEQFSKFFNPWGMSLPRGGGVPLSFVKENTMSQVIQAMSDADLLGMMVGSKTAARMLQDAGGSLSTLLNESIPSYDVQPKVRTKLQVAKELVRRSLLETLRHRDALSSPASVRDYLRMTLTGRDYEVFMVLFLDAQNRVIESEEMFRGTLTQTSVYPREVVKRSLFNNAAALIFAHNHPSGVAEPSHADEVLTQSLKQALALVDIKVLDHFIVAGSGLMSFAERGLL